MIRVGAQVKVVNPIPGLAQIPVGALGYAVQHRELEQQGNLAVMTAVKFDDFVAPVSIMDALLEEVHAGSIRPISRADQDYLD